MQAAGDHTMRITKVETLRADGGWRPFSFVKISTDEGLVGWSEFLEGAWSPALPEVIAALGRSVVGADPRAFARIAAELRAVTEFTAGGLGRQGIAAIENACIDIAAKAAGVPVYALFGGPLRTVVDVYWSHCGRISPRRASGTTSKPAASRRAVRATPIGCAPNACTRLAITRPMWPAPSTATRWP